MKMYLLYILILLPCSFLIAQKEFHVFPIDDSNTPGNPHGDGSLKLPWDLQTALSQKSEMINGGDTIWLHEGIYKGRFTSSIKSIYLDKKIVVQAFEEDKVVFDGNVNSNNGAVLTINGPRVIYKNFHVTNTSSIPRDENHTNFKKVAGINHLSGEDCEFIGLKIYDNPGLGLGSWKQTGGSQIEECLIFNNGFISKTGKGGGEGIYTQNTSDKTRVIKNNVIFNNYYKAIEVWSANKHANYEYVKNFDLNNNILFNSGLPSGNSYDNLIVATDDRDGINIAKNISISNNVFYHNTDIANKQINGNAPSLTLGFHKGAPVQNVRVENNWIVGRNNALRILHAESLVFKNNLVYSGYVALQPLYNKKQPFWDFSNNNYYTKKQGAFRFHKTATYNLQAWNKNILHDSNSQWYPIKSFPEKSYVKVVPSVYKDNTFIVAVFDKNSRSVSVDFSKFLSNSNAMVYEVQNIEDDSVIAKNDLPESKMIAMPVGTFNQTHTNYGVYRVVVKEKINKEELRKTIFGKLFRWLGF